jgi:purine-binding chemotaxis protein CheW
MTEPTGRSQTAQELVTFHLDHDLYGVEVEQVVEVNRDLIWTPIPGAAPYVRGAANLRGHIVTIVDLRKILDYDERPEDLAKTVIIVNSRDELVGILVDRIADVVEADRSLIESAPRNMPQTQARCLSGVLKIEGGLISLLDLNAALD